MTVRICEICKKILAKSNPNKNRCFYHALSPKDQKKVNEAPTMGSAPLCSSRPNAGFVRAMLDYHGGPKDL